MATKGPGVSFLTEVTIYARGMHNTSRKALRYHIRVAKVGILAVERTGECLKIKVFATAGR